MGNSRQGRLDKASARLDMDWLVLARPSCLGSSWHGEAGLGRLGSSGRGQTGQAVARHGRPSVAWLGQSELGLAVTAGHDVAGPGLPRHVKAWPSWPVLARRDMASQGVAWPSRSVEAWRGASR